MVFHLGRLRLYRLFTDQMSMGWQLWKEKWIQNRHKT